uniref:Ribosomal protein S9 n=1 Tax=Euglena hiemalis TaxID=392896 RepID=A0A345UC27_9EUGL|nr:ribosomal protein S9 [Euglena hiemalis]AXI98013.1 ribosomal protein S9 [Euglena hiemalis]
MKFDYLEVVGKRKSSIARIIIFLPKEGGGKITINGEQDYNYLQLSSNNPSVEIITNSPLRLLEVNNYFIHAYVKGGGLSGQAEALDLLFSKSLKSFGFSKKKIEKKLKNKMVFLTRKFFMQRKEKYGLKKARKAPQYSKR